MLHYEALPLLLRRVFPIGSYASPLTFRLAFCGTGGTKGQKPQYEEYLLERHRFNVLADYTNTLANEGAAPDAWTRNLIGYARATPVWTIGPEAGGVRVDSQQVVWPNVVPWEAAGDWGVPVPPYKWHEPPYHAECGYPWQIPTIHPSAFPAGAPTGWAEALAANLHRLGGFPVARMLLIANDALAASTVFSWHAHVRPGGQLRVPFACRWWHPVAADWSFTDLFRLRAAEAMYGTKTFGPWTLNLCTNAALTPASTAGDLIVLTGTGADPQDLASWTYTAPTYDPGPPLTELTPPIVTARLAGAQEFRNASGAAWPTVTYLALTTTVDGVPLLAAYFATGGVTVQPGEALTLPDGIALTIEDHDDA